MSERHINDPCSIPSPLQPDVNNDPIKPNCTPDTQYFNPEGGIENLFYKDVPFVEDPLRQKYGLGQSNNCDPVQSGELTDGSSPPSEVIHRNAQGLRAVDEAMKDLFSNIHVEDDLGKIHRVPIIYGSQEAAVAYVLQENVRKDQSLIVDRLRLPLMSIYCGNYDFAKDRYIYHKAIDYLRADILDGKPGFTTQERYPRDTIFGFSRGLPLDMSYELSIWTMYTTDMKQILEQVIQKFSMTAYIKLQGINNWDNIVELGNITSNETREVEENTKRVIKYNVGMTAKIYIPQPIVRKKAVLTTKVEVVDGLNEKDIQDVIARLEQSVGDLKCMK